MKRLIIQHPYYLVVIMAIIVGLAISQAMNGCQTLQNDCLLYAMKEQDAVGHGRWTRILIIDYTKAGYAESHAMLLSEVGHTVWASDRYGSYNLSLLKATDPKTLAGMAFIMSGRLRGGGIQINKAYFADREREVAK